MVGSMGFALTPPSSGSGQPTLQQIFVSSSNPSGVGGDTGSAFTHTLAAPIGAGNTVIFTASYPHGISASITDNNGNSWGSAAKSVDAGTGNFILSTWVLIGANAGLTTFELNIGATAEQPVSFVIEEWNNITAVDVTAGAASQSGSTLSTGSMTTTVNGDLIRAFYHPAANIGGNPTSWAAAASWTLMDGDIAWNSNQGYPKASQFIIQSAHGAINPTITINGDTGDAFNCVAVALKSGAAGTMYSGCRVLKHVEFTCNALASASWRLQTPTLGNLRLFGTTVGISGGIQLDSVTDSESNTWANVTTSGFVQAALLQNSVVNQNLISTINWGAGSTGSSPTIDFYDIVNAKTSGQPGTVVSNGLTGESGSATTYPNQPTMTPSQLGSVILAWLNNQGAGGGSNAGLTTGVSSPSEAVWAGVNYTGKTGGSQFDFGDGWAIVTNNNTLSSISFNWTVIAFGATNNVGGTAIEILHQ